MNPACPESLSSWLRSRLAIGLVLLAGGVPAGCRQGGASETKSDGLSPEAPARMTVIVAQLQNWPRVVRLQGSLVADEQAIVGAKVAGRTKEVHVDLGSVVRRGALLVSLEPEEFDLRVEQAEAQLEEARAKLGLKSGQKEESLDRLKVPAVVQEKIRWDEAKTECHRARDLLEHNAIAMEEVQQREAALAVAETRYRASLDEVDEQVAQIGMRRAALGLMRQHRTDAVIRAPFDSVVQRRHVAPGSYVAVGEAVVTLVRTDPLRFHGGLPEREVPYVRLGQPVQIRVEGEESPRHGRVTRICPALDTASRSLILQMDLPNPDSRLRVGVFAQAEIVIDAAAKTLAVPTGALREFAGVEKVWVVRHGEAVEQAVQTGRRSAERVEILDGLSLGDAVVVDYRQGRPGPAVAEQGPPVEVPKRK